MFAVENSKNVGLHVIVELRFGLLVIMHKHNYKLPNIIQIFRNRKNTELNRYKSTKVS